MTAFQEALEGAAEYRDPVRMDLDLGEMLRQFVSDELAIFIPQQAERVRRTLPDVGLDFGSGGAVAVAPALPQASADLLELLPPVSNLFDQALEEFIIVRADQASVGSLDLVFQRLCLLFELRC